MTAEARYLPAEYEGERFERLHESDDHPRFPDPYMDVYLRLVQEMEDDMAVIPGMGTLAQILIRRVARDHVAALMADRQDSVMMAVRCPQGHIAFQPWWPENNARLLRSASELLRQARSADLGHALRTEFVIGLVQEVMTVLEHEVSSPEERVRLKESMRAAFKSFLDAQQSRRIGG